ncbi:hypothetical protein C2S51_033817 [Perilla frutescens var. frutescens]|nr:hypothetical protein C2S51_033817 [Perilla frutescens var. frutescens]
MTAGIMEVTVVGARDLKNTEYFGRIDPYVVIQYKNEEQKSTTGRPKTTKSRLRLRLRCCICLQGQGGRRAVWNEKFKIRVEYPEEKQQQKLLLKIMDNDNFTQHDYLGQATVYLNELFEVGVEKGKAELPIQKYRIVSSNNTYHGEIQVGITFTMNGGSELMISKNMVDGKENKAS